LIASHFRQLEVWQLAIELVSRVYRLTSRFPREERYGLSAQLQRSAVSIPSNIAEGNARASTRDYARFVNIAMGSCAELQTQLIVAERLELAHDAGDCFELSERVSQMLLRLHQSLERKLLSGSRVPGPGSRPESTEIA
jgi:four helix bundle protein